MKSRLASLSLLLLPACDVDLGARVPTPERSFGEIVYREACQRVTYSAELEARRAGGSAPLDASGVSYRALCEGSGGPPPGAPAVTAALVAERRGIISDVDTVAPRPLLDGLDGYLRAVVPLEDDGTVSRIVRGAGGVLGDLGRDQAAVAALGRLGWRDGFRPPRLDAGIPRALLADPTLDPTLGALLPALSPSTQGAGDARAEEALRQLLRATATSIREAEAVPDAAAADRTLRIALRFLLSSHPDLRALPEPVWAVLRDHRGLPLVDASGGLPAPYVDRNGDGLADVDGGGRFVGADGAALPQASPFPVIDAEVKDRAAGRDAQGRALRKAGEAATLYRYADLSGTALGALVREGKDLLDPNRDMPLSLLAGAAHLLGPRRDATKQYASGKSLAYRGFTEEQGALLDLVYGYLQLAGYSDTGDGSGADMSRFLAVVQALLRDSEPLLSRNLGAVAAAMDEGKKPEFDAARLPETATLYDDLAPVLVRILRTPGLVSDLIDAMRDPAAADLGPLAALLATDSSLVYMNQDQLDWTRANATVGAVGKAVRRDLPDSDVDKVAGNASNNRSILQRTLHLVHDANGLTFCNRRDARIKILGIPISYADPCSLFKIDDLALFYVLAVIGKDIQARPGDYHATSVAGADFYNALSDGFQRDLIRFFGGLGEAVLEGLLGIPGFGRYPHPAVLARMLFQEQDKRSDFLTGSIDGGACSPARAGTLCCNQNHGWKDHHDGVLFTLERLHPKDAQGRERTDVTFFSAFKPIVRAFAKHAECTKTDGNGRCTAERSAAKILVDLLAVLHRHWPTPESRFFGQQYEARNQKSGVVRYEPLIARLMGGTDLWPSTLALAPALQAVKTPSGAPGLPVIANFLRWFLDPASPRIGGQLAYRDGRTQALRGDGQPAFRRSDDPIIVDIVEASAAGRVTPYYLLADAYRKKRERLAQDPQIERRWKTAVSQLADLMISSKPGPGYGFQDPRTRPLQILLIDLLRERIEAHGRAGDLRAWLQGQLPGDLRDSLTGPVFAGAADLAARLGEDEGARKAVQGLLSRLLDPAAGAGAASVLSTTGDLLQLLLDDTDLVPILRGLGPALDPEAGPVEGALALVRRGRERDPDKVLLTVLNNLYRADGTGLYPLFRLTQATVEIDRRRAGEPGVRRSDLDAADYAAMLTSTADFLADKGRGLSRFLDIVRSRKP